MTVFRPTVAAPGRLMRLGVVLDTRNRPDRFREVARMCDGAGIESLWVRDEPLDSEGTRLEAWTALTLAATETRRPSVGAVVSTRLRPAETLAAMAATLDAASGGRLELTFAGEGTDLERYVRTTRRLLENEAVEMTGQREDDIGIPRLSIEIRDDVGADVAATIADDVLVPAERARDVRSVAQRVRASCERSGRDPATTGIAVEVPVSIGRTTAEAHARAAAEPLFETVGRPAEIGVFGTLEQCQERVIDLAHEGVTDLRCILPNTGDVHDVIAQLTAMVVGSADVLTPNAPRSKAPDPPKTWGGRAPSR